MVGIPRKPYCQPCKRRRVKCDEKWPTCSACARAGIECPGPSTQMKFVLNNNHKASGNGKNEAMTLASVSTSSFPQPMRSSDGAILLPRPTAYKPKAARHGPGFFNFRLVDLKPQPILFNKCDKISSQLVSLINSAPNDIMTGLFRPLPEIPRRLGQSECLQDSISFWCSSWADYYQGLRYPSRKSQGHYGKLLVSLQHAVQGPKALSVETLAASTILYKTGEIFNLESYQTSSMKLMQGITTLTKEKGLPDFNDPMDVMLTYENQSVIALVSIDHPNETEFYNSPAWKEAINNVLKQVYSAENVSEMDIICEEYGPRWVEHLQFMRSCHLDLASISREAATALELELQQALFDIEALFPRHWVFIQEKSGNITEVTDPAFFVGSKYELQNPETFLLIEDTFQLQLALNRMLVHLRRLFGKPDDLELEERYQKMCNRLWMFIPYLKTQDPLYADSTISFLCLTIEAASQKEKEYLVDFIECMDVNHQLGESRDSIILNLHRQAEQLLGARDIQQ